MCKRGRGMVAMNDDCLKRQEDHYDVGSRRPKGFLTRWYIVVVWAGPLCARSLHLETFLRQSYETRYPFLRNTLQREMK